MEQKLKEYGFSDFTIDKLMTGKVTLVSYGKVKLNKRLNRLITYYPNGKIKEEQLWRKIITTSSHKKLLVVSFIKENKTKERKK